MRSKSDTNITNRQESAAAITTKNIKWGVMWKNSTGGKSFS